MCPSLDANKERECFRNQDVERDSMRNNIGLRVHYMESDGVIPCVDKMCEQASKQAIKQASKQAIRANVIMFNMPHKRKEREREFAHKFATG